MWIILFSRSGGFDPSALAATQYVRKTVSWHSGKKLNSIEEAMYRISVGYDSHSLY